MNFHQYFNCDVLNGPGTRCTLFVSGCEHQCRGCYNQSTWPVKSGMPFTQEMENRLIDDLLDKRIHRRGLSLSGGDPLHPANLPDVYRLIRRVRAECPGKDIWLWTGYVMEHLSEPQRQVVAMIDVMVDGPFVRHLHNPGLQWRGSSNQRILRKAGAGGAWMEAKDQTPSAF
ncbi:anaerobic ribonucleoside-triphosphate reductase-activating protein [Photobacterium galatheae]|uniref:anaerobic ribonucleoside-triphosphate reductase-activating protein n=1 Tax=Photobacterium galatheae TaxID=1654360 RepID=UPI00202CEE9D|nr:anaerobic ribonucleoside-triphosphate reductase-activating protein [Photobacterium galatheae]MCM0148636.1 anaerobic ribonucleoside-triphosphate reductase-activating protein [Photobacterium galatheae]